MKVFITTLGCEKNTVDSENAAALLKQAGCVLVNDPEDADVFIVNTCGFIHDAKQQSIETIFDLSRIKGDSKKLIVTGCLSQRYAKELAESMPEVDSFLGVNDYNKLPEIILGSASDRVFCSNSPKTYEELGGRVLSTAPWTRSIKIAEGCSNVCAYCAIPFIRGRYRSRSEESILAEAKALAAEGCKELVVIAQDVTFYGRDLGLKEALPALLKKLCKIEGIEWIRLMYCYEDEITDSLIQTIKEEDKICKYLDIPIQHSVDHVLKDMNRKSTSESINSTINKLRQQIPGIVIRTTLITGFPGETAQDAKELTEFVKDTRFERLGVFAYSKEEGTKAASMKPQVRKDVKERRRDRIMELQRSISLENNISQIGKTFKVLVEEPDDKDTYIGRSYMDAPDIDNNVIFTSTRPLQPGSFVDVKITDAFDYDLCGEAVYESAK